MKSILIFLLISTIKCSAQSGETGPLPIAPPTYDTIPCYLLFRTKSGQIGIVKGWEVRAIETRYIEDSLNIGGKVKYLGGPRRPLKVWHSYYFLSDWKKFPRKTIIWKLEQPIKQ